MNVYFIPGLAADRSVFKYIQLPDGYNPVYLDWIPPVKNEPMQQYALRMAEKIDHGKPFAVVGLSLGGMIAIEITKQYPASTLIIISSIPTSRHLPQYLTYISKFRIHKMVPVSILKSASFIKRYFSDESAEDKLYLRKAIRESDPVFIRWAINAILNWKSMDLPEHCVHIHGTHDEVLPVRFTQPTHFIEGGKHLMILTRASEINNIFKELFDRQHTGHLPLA